jgi:hypothetical protein
LAVSGLYGILLGYDLTKITAAKQPKPNKNGIMKTKRQVFENNIWEIFPGRTASVESCFAMQRIRRTLARDTGRSTEVSHDLLNPSSSKNITQLSEILFILSISR